MSVVDSIRKTMVPIHREGWPFIAAFALVTFFHASRVGAVGLSVFLRRKKLHARFDQFDLLAPSRLHAIDGALI